MIKEFTHNIQIILLFAVACYAILPTSFWGKDPHLNAIGWTPSDGLLKQFLREFLGVR